MTNPQVIQDMSAAGTSVWLDDLSRQRITSGNLVELINSKGIVGVTTNPAIFAAAMSDGDSYADQIAELAAAGTKVDDAVFEMTIRDVQDACDAFADIYKETDGVDGRVSLEVDPRLALNHDATVVQAKDLATRVGRENLMVKIPATVAGLPAITDVLAAGVSVNVTLIFSVERYEQVMDAFIAGIRQARDNGHDLSKIHSVASFFVSRVDSEIDAQLSSSNSSDTSALQGKAGVANARLAYAAFEKKLVNNPEWQELAESGGRIQRPLWASTSVKNPEYPDTMYVTELVGPHTVNTMPEATLDATIDHGEVKGNTLTETAAAAHEVFDQLTDKGIDLPQVWATLEDEGVQKFVVAWEELLATLQEQLDAQVK